MHGSHGDKLPGYRGQSAVLAGVLLSAGLHAAALVWWLARPAPAPLQLGMEQAVTVDLLALAPPAGEQVQPPAPEPVAVQPDPEPLKPDEMAEQHKVVKSPPVRKSQPPKPAPKQQVEQATAAPVPTASAAVPSSAPPAPAPVTAARYDAAYLNNPAPGYPPLSRRLGEQGKVLLRVQVSADGKPLAVEVKTSSGFTRLDEAAGKAAAKWRFVPARQGETAVVSWVEVPIQFSLQE